MRKLMWFSIGFTLAVICFAYFFSGGILLLLAVICGALIAVLLLIRKKYCKTLAIVMIGASVGFTYCLTYDSLFLSYARAYDGESQYIQLEATDYSFDTDYGSAVDCATELDGRNYKVRLYYQNDEAIEPGDRICGNVELRFTPKDSAGNSTYHKGEGIFLLGFAEDDMELNETPRLPAKYIAAYLRKSIAQRISEIFPQSTAAFGSALLLGDDSNISYRDNIAFQKSGIRHVIAVSGLHVSILFSVLYFFTGKKRLLTLLIGFPVLLLFAAVAGFTPSVVRACLMQALVILAIAVNKEYDTFSALSFAVLVMLFINPLTVTSVSFQLSVGSMIGIFAFSGPIRHYLQDDKRFGKPKGKSIKARLKRWFVGSVSVSVSALIVTLPLCAAYFGTVSVIGIVTNLLTLWVISFIFCGIIIACVLSLIWMPLGIGVGWIVSVPIHYVLMTARLLSSIPFGVAYTDSPYTILWIVTTCILLLVFLIIKRKSPLLLVLSVTVMYGISLFMTWAEPRTANFQLTVLDVGQGQCVLLQSKEEAFLIDCGGEDSQYTATIALNALGAQGIHKLDGLILTHYDKDHAGGAVYLTQVMPVSRLYLPDTDPQNEIRCYFEEQEIPVSWVKRNTSIDCNAGKISLYPAESEAEGNESSMCILFQIENCDILITGDRDIDGESRLLQQAKIPGLDVLVVGHHGASTSTGLDLLYETKPKIAVISVGEDNPHGHPHTQTLRRLQRVDCLIRRTDLEGTIIIRG